MSPVRSVCVFCGSRPGADPAYAQTARAFGRLLGERGIGLVYGGGGAGLMGAVADGSLEAGGHVVGVIPKSMVEAERAHPGVVARGEMLEVHTMHERKSLMHQRSDAFVALPGGVGTFEEVFEAIAWDQLDLHNKPIGFLNTGGFYTKLREFIDGSHAAGFVPQTTHEVLAWGETAESLLDELQGRAAVHREPRLGLTW